MTNNPLSSLFKKGLLSEPGDTLIAQVTKTGRQVIKIRKNNGLYKASATRYPSTGTIVKTISDKLKK